MQPLAQAARHSRWGIVVLAITSGIVAAIQVGKVPPLIAQLQLDLEMSLISAGWLASLFNLTGAFLGIFGGALADKLGPRRVLMAGLGGFAAAGFVGALAEHGAWLLVCRTIESITMLACTVSAPRFIVAAANDQTMGDCILPLYRSAAQPAMAQLGTNLHDAKTNPGLVIIPTADGDGEPGRSLGGADGLVGRPLVEVERFYIEQALELVDGKREDAAALLGIGERTLYRKIKEYGLNQ